MNNVIVDPPPIDLYAKWKRTIADIKSVTVKMTPFVDFVAKSLPIAAASATAVAYLFLLFYTSRYSIPFPYTFLPYLVMFSLVIVIALMVIGVLAFFPLYSRVITSDVEYHKILKVRVEGGPLRWRRCPQLIRQFTNLIAPAIAFEIIMIVDISFQDIKDLGSSFAGGILFVVLILQGFLFAWYIYNNFPIEHNNKFQLLLSVVNYSLLCNVSFWLWFILVIFALLEIPQIANYSGDYELAVAVSLLLIVFIVQGFLFFLGVIESRHGIVKFAIVAAIFIALFAVIFYPGGITLIKNVLFVHNLGGGVTATLSVKGDACQHLNNLIEKTTRTAPEEVCATKPVAVLLNIGDTIYVKEASSAAAEHDGKEPTDTKNNDPTSDKVENVWSVDRSAVIGMEFQSRGKSK